ncbi:MAG: VOC family protein [Peptococcaceae bacterium]|nr:VOC family protein [Peptococcaceae bacterium]
MYTNMTTNLMVEDVKKSLGFYEGMLGFSVTATVPNESDGFQFAILVKDNIHLMLQERTNLISELPSYDTPRVQPSATLYVMVDNFGVLYEELKAKTELLCELHETFYGVKEFAVADCDGYAVVFTEHKEI